MNNTVAEATNSIVTITSMFAKSMKKTEAEEFLKSETFRDLVTSVLKTTLSASETKTQLSPVSQSSSPSVTRASPVKRASPGKKAVTFQSAWQAYVKESGTSMAKAADSWALLEDEKKFVYHIASNKAKCEAYLKADVTPPREQARVTPLAAYKTDRTNVLNIREAHKDWDAKRVGQELSDAFKQESDATKARFERIAEAKTAYERRVYANFVKQYEAMKASHVNVEPKVEEPKVEPKVGEPKVDDVQFSAGFVDLDNADEVIITSD